jgi:hypothetical protein
MDKEDLIVNRLHTEALLLLKQKKNDELIINQLIKQGIDRHYAEMILENVKNDLHDKKQLYLHILIGAFILLSGLAMTILSYISAFQGGSYLIFYGLVVTGIIVIIRGVITYKK